MGFLFHIIIAIAHWIPTVLGYNLVFGKGKILHFGPLGISCAVGYTLFLTSLHTGSYFVGFIVALCVSIILSLIFAQLALRLPTDAFGVMTIALHLATLTVVLNWNSVTRGALGIPRIPRPFGIESIEVYTIYCVTIALIFLGIFLAIERSAFGRRLSALAEHEWYASSIGISQRTIYSIAFVILGICHVFGVFMAAPYMRLLHPSDYHFSALIFLVMVVVAGKPGSVWGVTLSTILIVSLKEGLRLVAIPADMIGPVRHILFGLILFSAVWIRKDTLFPKERTI